MKVEKHIEILNEVLDEIASAVKDARGLVAHQRRLAFSLSLGATTLLELYLHENNVIKEGAKFNHLWFRRRKDVVLNYVQQRTISSIKYLENIEKIVELIIRLEEKRDELAYGSPVSENILKEKINLFFELKNLIKC